MPIVSMPGLRPVNMGELAAEMSREGPGGNVIRVRAMAALDPYPRSLVDRLRHWAQAAPDRVFLADRGPDGEWRRLTYAQVLEKTRSLAQALIDRFFSRTCA
jgi:feruloyl-CoA synthase